MKLHREKIEVEATTLGTPQAVRRGRFFYRVYSIDENWEYQGRWWLDAPELMGTHREYYRITCITKSRSLVTMDIYQEEQAWYLARVLD